jgi:hypothetical protein
MGGVNSFLRGPAAFVRLYTFSRYDFIRILVDWHVCSAYSPRMNSFVPDMVSTTLCGFRSRCVMPLRQIN